MQYVTASGKSKHWSNIADGGGKDQLCPMVKPSFWARLSLLVFFSRFWCLGRRWGELCQRSRYRGGDTSRRLVAGTMYICNQPKTETALNAASYPPTLFMGLGVRVICTAAILLGTPQAMNGPLQQRKECLTRSIRLRPVTIPMANCETPHI